ncbi:class I SAM-dependent methyltransferase [Acetobacter tropicalis]|uniref:Methyltransferase-like protein n=1 Tax=Acetobacter tropicalis TaxID=104102 RepID=A0A094YPD1_9PROT|nr:class I SAM-dependent methyltransferase [Acetobacter tropicalis]KGB22474.1 methyltransferase-like protein [Acetobacter tropicalis]MBC9007592.1 class I SAM-dependent methyltransferase [Acetobacter tropicalis]MDO8172771.1 class I SAM-dependent methyltransferase [Acetobacter tropicalis]
METPSFRNRRTTFGENAAAYQEARPPYPAVVYDHLRACIPFAGARIFEIGPGTGQATRILLDHQPEELTAIEPDPRLCAYLAEYLAPTAPHLTVIPASWEDAPIEAGTYDLGIAATAFHWLPQAEALRKVHRALKPGGWWAMWWNVFGDPNEPDAFHLKASPLFAQLGESRSWQQGQLPFALNRTARLDDLHAAGFQDVEAFFLRWNITMTTAQISALAATFSQISAADPAVKTHILHELAKLADQEFGGIVERRFMTALYTARKPPRSSGALERR